MTRFFLEIWLTPQIVVALVQASLVLAEQWERRVQR
jgi:hypothetical protein